MSLVGGADGKPAAEPGETGIDGLEHEGEGEHFVGARGAFPAVEFGIPDFGIGSESVDHSVGKVLGGAGLVGVV